MFSIFLRREARILEEGYVKREIVFEFCEYKFLGLKEYGEGKKRVGEGGGEGRGKEGERREKKRGEGGRRK